MYGPTMYGPEQVDSSSNMTYEYTVTYNTTRYLPNSTTYHSAISCYTVWDRNI